MKQTPLQELIEVLKIHRDTAFEKEKMCGAEAKSYYEGRAIAFEDAISFAEFHLEKEKEVMCEFAYKCRNIMAADELAINHWYDKTFNAEEK